eukprot:2594344-Amphidinium_carterae.1
MATMYSATRVTRPLMQMPSRTRTYNPRLRRLMPYPLGYGNSVTTPDTKSRGRFTPDPPPPALSRIYTRLPSQLL